MKSYLFSELPLRTVEYKVESMDIDVFFEDLAASILHPTEMVLMNVDRELPGLVDTLSENLSQYLPYPIDICKAQQFQKGGGDVYLRGEKGVKFEAGDILYIFTNQTHECHKVVVIRDSE